MHTCRKAFSLSSRLFYSWPWSIFRASFFILVQFFLQRDHSVTCPAFSFIPPSF